MLSLALSLVYKTLRKLNIVLSLEEKYTARIEQTIRTTRREITHGDSCKNEGHDSEHHLA